MVIIVGLLTLLGFFGFFGALFLAAILILDRIAFSPSSEPYDPESGRRQGD